ncbi:MAG TPA: TSUP family transporter, partial [Gemmatimonadaceae bacterium]
RLGAPSPPKPTLRSFAAIGAGASVLSALVGSVGPLMAPLFLSFGLLKGAYIGTEALATVVTHVAKLIAYQRTNVLSSSAALVGLALGPVMVGGSVFAKRIVSRMPERVFVLVIEATMFGAGLLFLIRG